MPEAVIVSNARTAGGGVFGHSFGMTGCRLAGHSLIEGRRRGVGWVAVSMFAADGVGAAGLLEISK